MRASWMVRLRALACLVLVPWLVGLAGCENAAEQTPPDAADSAGAPPESAATRHAAPEHSREHASVGQEPQPLLPIMLRMSADLAGMMQALWMESYEGMAKHAGAIAAHADISAEELERIELELGPEMAAFEAADEAVHEASLRLFDAAKAENMDAFLEHLATVQRGCVGCHARFRERLRTNRP